MISSPGHAERKLAPDVRARQAASWSAQATDKRKQDAARSAALSEHRTRVEGGVVVRAIRIPNRRVRLRPTGCCPYCTGSAFELHWPPVDVEHVPVNYRGSLACLLCGRVVVKLQIGCDDEQTPSEQFHALPPHLKLCPDCGIRTTRVKNDRCRECWKSAKTGGRQPCSAS